jgi:uroporphyrinogen decarboxylase
MNGYERMMAAVRGERPDRVPIWELIINRPVIKALCPELFSSEKVARYEWGSCGGFLLQADFIEKEGLDGITVFEDYRVQREVDATTFVDEWGITWKTEENGIPYPVGHPIQSEADLDAYEPPDPDAVHRLESLELAVERFKGQRAIVFLSHDAFEFSHNLRGMTNLLMDYALNPDLAHRLARIVMDYKTRVMQHAADLGADILCTGDDYAHRQAPIMSPEHFRRFVLPYLREAVQVARDNGLPFLKHTDGNLWPIMDDIVGAGIDCLDPLEPIADMDMLRVKETYGDRIALAGNVDCGQLLPRGTEEQVVEAVRETIAKGAPGGGFILASSNSIHPAVKPANYRAMVEAGRRFGAYPLDPEMVAEYREKDYMARYR